MHHVRQGLRYCGDDNSKRKQYGVYDSKLYAEVRQIIGGDLAVPNFI